MTQFVCNECSFAFALRVEKSICRVSVIAYCPACGERSIVGAESATAQRTVKVRVAVAADHKKKWQATGRSGAPDTAAMAFAVDLLEPGAARYWLEAELPVPEKAAGTVVQAEVVPEK